jgi:hypothetical protein
MTALASSKTIGNVGLTLLNAFLFAGLPAVMLIHAL